MSGVCNLIDPEQQPIESLNRFLGDYTLAYSNYVTAGGANTLILSLAVTTMYSNIRRGYAQEAYEQYKVAIRFLEEDNLTGENEICQPIHDMYNVYLALHKDILVDDVGADADDAGDAGDAGDADDADDDASRVVIDDDDGDY